MAVGSITGRDRHRRGSSASTEMWLALQLRVSLKQLIANAASAAVIETSIISCREHVLEPARIGAHFVASAARKTSWQIRVGDNAASFPSGFCSWVNVRLDRATANGDGQRFSAHGSAITGEFWQKQPIRLFAGLSSCLEREEAFA